MAADRPAAAERSRSLMHGIFVGEIQALEGAGRTCFDFDDDEAPFQLKLDMARQCWDESRHCEISVKLGDHMGTEIGEYTESTFLYAAACNPDPVLRLCGVNRALEGLAIDVFSTMKEFGNESGDPVLEFCEDWMLADEVTHVKMGSDWLRRLTENDPERRERALEFQRTVDKHLQPRRLPRRGRREPDPARAQASATGRLPTDEDRRARARSRCRRRPDGREAMSARALPPAAVSRDHVTVTPDPFTLIAYDAAEIAALVEDAAATVGVPADVEHLARGRRGALRAADGHMSDVVDGDARALDLGRQLRGPASARRFSSPSRPGSTSRSCVAARPTTASRRLRRRPARRRALPRRAGRLGHLRRRPAPSGSASVTAPARLLRLPAPARLHRRGRRRVRTLLGRPDDDLGRLREICKETGAADRGRRRRSRRHPPPEVACAQPAGLGRSTLSRLLEVVGGDRVVEVDVRLRPRAAGRGRGHARS